MKKLSERGGGGSRRDRASVRPVTLSIQELAAGGSGIARTEQGEVVFVPGTASGDVVEADVDRSVRPARGKVLRVLTPGPGRVEPLCAFVTSCGGCDWMHLSAATQQEAHAVLVQRAIRRTTSDVALPPLRVHPAPQPFGYRTRARLLAKASRGGSRRGSGRGVHGTSGIGVGYRASGTHALVPVDRCLVLTPSLDALLSELPDLLVGATGEGDVLIAAGAGGRPVVELAWRGELAPSTWQQLDQRVAQGTWAGARVALEGVNRPASFGDPRPVIQGADGAPLLLSAGGFGQPSEEGASVLARRVHELVWLDAPSRPLHLLELFAGSGTLSVLLARGPNAADAADGEASLASFVAIEQGAEAAACLRENLAARGLSGKVVVADADATPIPPRVDVVVLDPPRGGASGAAAALAASSARVVVYVSCNPATLARDLALLTASGLMITHLEAVELFPQTSHVEVIVRLARRPARAAALS
ncbi:SAM-dependent methyltransferase [Chondromyces crocatus]|uniref:SAM-dependent methyltransferase n=1 Tax=Chondromyces crocatus TaxID=52 RepID=A0A0K1ES34_CHOCO|nr:SAM-dependent methyltransferase [Chondromyces crocatus]